MAKSRETDANGASAVVAGPKSTAIAGAGIRTGEEFAALMSALMSDVIEGRITPSIANAACNAGGKLLKVVEMQYRYGTTEPDAPKSRPLVLTGR